MRHGVLDTNDDTLGTVTSGQCSPYKLSDVAYSVEVVFILFSESKL